MKLSRGLAGAIACWLWLAACLGVVGWRFVQGLPVDTDIQSMLPSGGKDDVERAAIDLASRAAAGRIAILVGSADAKKADQAATDLVQRLSATGIFHSDMSDAETTGRWFYANRNQLLCERDPEQFTAERARQLSNAALSDIYSITGAVTGDLLRTDPFLLTVRLAECLSPVPLTTGDTRMVSGHIDTSAFRLDAQETVVATVDAWRAVWRAQGVESARAGAVFHASVAAESAKADIAVIGLLGSIGVAVLFFAIFRTVRSIVQAMVLVTIGLTAGTAAALLLFPTIHVLVFVFAAMLVGIVSDYAVHMLASGPATAWAPLPERMSHVGRPITVSMVTTVLSFSSLALFGAQLFQQVALLAGVGVFTAWAFVIYVLAPLDKRPKNAEALVAWWRKAEDVRAAVRIPRWLSWVTLIAVLTVTVYGVTRTTILDDVRQFQPRPADLVAEEEKVKAAGYAGSGVTFLLSRGGDLETAKRREEAALAQAPDKVRLLATTRFDPSQQRRTANEVALQTQLYGPHLARHVELTGVEDLDLRASPAADQPPWMATLSGKVAGGDFLIAPLLDPAGWSGPDVEGVELVDPSRSYSQAFAHYRELALIALIVAFACAAVAVVAVYRRIGAISILAPVLVATVIALFAPAAFGFPLSFFSFTGALVLVGVGVDYSAFQWEAGLKEDRWTAVAVGVDAATTLLSMGLLVLSNTYPVRSFGLTVAIGIAAALCLSHIPRLVARGRGLHENRNV